MAENVEVSSTGDQHKIIERSSHASNSNRKTGYINPNTKKAVTSLRQAFI